MPKAILEFQLPEERGEYELVVKAGEYNNALWEFDQWLRARQKHGEPCPTGHDELAIIRTIFIEYTKGLLDD